MITKLDVNWWHDYGNSPELEVYVDHRPPHNSFEYQLIPMGDSQTHNVFLLSTNNYPFVDYVYIENPHGNPTYCGALGGNYRLTNGMNFKSRTGWSSRAGAVNSRLADYLPNEIIDVVLYEDDFGWAGYALDVEYVKSLNLLPPGVHLVRELRHGIDIVWTPSTDPDKVVKKIV